MVPNSSTLSPALTLCPVTSMAVRSMHIRPTVFGLKEEGEESEAQAEEVTRTSPTPPPKDRG